MAVKESIGGECRCLAATEKDLLETALQIAMEYTEATIKSLERRIGAPSCQELRTNIREFETLRAKVSNTPTCPLPGTPSVPALVKPTVSPKPAPTKK